MKVLIFLCFVAVCACLPNTGKHITHQNGVITITSPKYQLTITRSADPRKMEILYKSTTGMKIEFEISEPLKLQTIRKDDLLTGQMIDILGEDYTQFDVVKAIFSQHQGMVDDVTYNKILEVFETLVHKGILNEHLLEIMKHIESPEDIKKLFISTDLSDPKIMVNDIVMPMEDGIARMREVSAVLPAKDAESVQELKERFTVVPLQKDNTPRFIGSQKYLSTDTLTPMQRLKMLLESNRQYQSNVMMERAQYTDTLTPMQRLKMILESNRPYQSNVMMERPQYTDTLTPMQRLKMLLESNRQYQSNVMMERPQYMTPTTFQRELDLERESDYPTMYESYRDSMMEMPLDTMDQRSMTPGNFQRYQSMYEQPRQSYMTPMNKFWENIMEEPLKEQQTFDTMFTQHPRMRDWMYPIKRDTQKVYDDVMMNEPMMKSMMNPQMMMMMKPRMMMMMPQQRKEMLMESGMENSINMDNEKIMTSDMARKLINERLMEQRMMNQMLMEQRMMNQGLMDEDMVEEMMYQPRRMFTMGKVPMQVV